jgi:hypothetical protein
MRWTIPRQNFGEQIPGTIGTALFPAPIKSLWIVASFAQRWHILNEDGFDLGQLFEEDPQKVVWPKVAMPGADMTHAAAMSRGSVTQARDGKLYVVTGDTACWHMEVTGLEKVNALPGGKLTIPPPK